jgi:hypothetical protein
MAGVDSEVGDRSPRAVLRMLRDQHRIIVDVATGVSGIAKVEEAYEELRDSLRPSLTMYGIEDPFPWRTLWEYWSDEAGQLGTYAARRASLNQRIAPAEDELHRLASSGLADWSSDEVPPSWAQVTARIHGMKAVFERAVELDDFQDVSRRCREVILAAARLLHRPWMVPKGQEPPQAANGTAMIDQICAALFSGSSNERLRKALRAALELAQERTHSSSTARVEAMAVAQGTIMVVKTFQEADRLVHAQEPTEGSEHVEPPDDYLSDLQA